MSDRFIFTKHRTDCYHCKQVADQAIKAVPYKAEVACDNCGATRVFVPRIEYVTQPGSFTKLGKYPVWELVQDATCRNCHVTGPHDITGAPVTSRSADATVVLPISLSSNLSTWPRTNSKS